MPARPIRLVVLVALLTIFGVYLLGPPPAAAQLAPDTAARIDSVFEDLNRSDGPGCALGVVRDGRLAYANGYGSSNLDYRRPITPETNFYMASVSKHATAAAVLVAARKGFLSLDDPVRKWLPDLPEYEGRTITIRHLVHQTSGLRDYLSLISLADSPVRWTRETEDYLDLVYRQQGPNFEPGSAYGYSNTNYLLLAEIVGEAAGSSLREFADENVFAPLGMRDTHFHDDRDHIVGNRAVGYARAEHGYRMSHPWGWDQVGSGGWYANIEDLARWDRNFDTEAVGGDEFTERMTTRGRLANGDTIDYAFGLTIAEYRGLSTVEHGGSFAGFRTHYRRFPEASLSTIVLCNFASANAVSRGTSVADILLADRLQSEEGTGEPGEGDTSSDSVSPDILERFAGDYRSPESLQYVAFRVDEEGLVLVGFGGEHPLRYVGSNRFELTGVPAEWVFGGGQTGRPKEVVHHFRGAETFRRVEIPSYSEAELSAFEGRYHSDELGADYRMVTAGDTLQVVAGTRAPEALRAGIRDEFRWGNTIIRFTRSGQGEVTGFTVSTDRARGIRFERRP